MSDPSQWLQQCIRLVNEDRPAMFTTVDGQGMPHSRWMTAAAIGPGIARIYTLAGKNTRKVQHLAQCSKVCWVFSSDDFGEVVTIQGTAQVVQTPLVTQRIWERLVQAARAYSVQVLSDDGNLELVTLETQVQSLELLSPRLQLFHPQQLSHAGNGQG